MAGETDNVEVVSRELCLDQIAESKCHLLGCYQTTTHRHRQAKIEHDDRSRLAEVLCSINFKVLRYHLHRDSRSASSQGGHQGLFQVKKEGVAEFVLLGFI